MRKRMLVSLSEEKLRWIEEMRVEDYEQETPLASYIVRLITKEKKRRDEEKVKARPGRPRKEDGQNVGDGGDVLVPHPDPILRDQGVMVTEDEAQMIKGGLKL